MKSSLPLFLLLYAALLFSCREAGCQTEQTTVILVRHTEKIAGTDSLSETGKLRAIELARVLKDVSFSAVYCSQYQRTFDTALPLLTQMNLSGSFYHTSNLPGLMNEIQRSQKGKVVLIVGHSNTLWPVMKLFGLKTNQTDLPDNAYDDLFILNVVDGQTPKLLRIQYGPRSD